MANEYNILETKLSYDEFETLSKFIYKELGIKLPPVKKIMLESRLQKRLKDVGINNFKDYIDYLFSKEGKSLELVHMIDVVTTNKTDFFREPAHFDYLNDFVFKEVTGNNSNYMLRLWSAGCSSGEEPYTLSMILSEAIDNGLVGDFNIFATDISTRILQHAIDAIYSMNKIEDVPLRFKKKYLLKSKNPTSKTVRITPELRSKIAFQRLNFMDDSYNVSHMFDIIFCRNVIIYFDRQTQEKVINKLCSKLKTGGYLFLGHSESIAGMDVPLTNIRPTVFKKTDSK